MKGDFTLTGKRTIFGLINDGRLSLTRYFINNFYDGYYSDALNISSGNLNPM